MTDKYSHFPQIDFTSDCLNFLKIYERKYLYDWYAEHEYSEDGIKIERTFEPVRLREWLKRNNISEDEGFDEVTFETSISDYVHFLSWLAKNAHCHNLSEIEDYYDDDELEAYKKYRTYA